LQATPIAGTEGGTSPFLSPDARWVGFWADGKLKKVSIDGGVPVTLCDVAMPFGASWGPDDTIVFSPSNDSGLSRVPANGGKAEILTSLDKTVREFSHRLPHWLPDGKGVLFTILREKTDLEPRVARLDVNTRKWSVLLEDAADARYALSGHLVFLRQGTLMAVPLDLARSAIVGQPVPVIAGIVQALNTLADVSVITAAGQYGVSDSGYLVYAPGGIFPDLDSTLVWVDRNGNVQPAASPRAWLSCPRLSPDGKQIAYITRGKEWLAWVYDLNRGTATQLTTEGKVWAITWTPDGKRVIFDWRGFGTLHFLYSQPADGSSPMERLSMPGMNQDLGSFSPDGATLAFEENHPETGEDILLLDLRSRRVTPFLNSKANEMDPTFSPDGRWLAYESDESGRLEVYVRPIRGPGGKWQISSDGGNQPLWARSGKQLFYRQTVGDGIAKVSQVWAVDVRTDGSFAAGKPRLMFKTLVWFQNSIPPRCWDISLDDQRFLMVQLEERKSQPLTEMILVTNWFEELKRLAPTGRK
jgi:serine/threonine-protein kinase